MDEDLLSELGLDAATWRSVSTELRAWLRLASTREAEALPTHLRTEFETLPHHLRAEFGEAPEQMDIEIAGTVVTHRNLLDLSFRRIIGNAFSRDD